MAEHEQLLRQAYEAFNARDIEAALAFVHPDVRHEYELRDGLVVRMDIVGP